MSLTDENRVVPRPAVSAGLWETQTSGPTSDLQYQNVHFNTIPSGFICTLKFEKRWSVPSVVLWNHLVYP